MVISSRYVLISALLASVTLLQARPAAAQSLGAFEPTIDRVGVSLGVRATRSHEITSERASDPTPRELDVGIWVAVSDRGAVTFEYGKAKFELDKPQPFGILPDTVRLSHLVAGYVHVPKRFDRLSPYFGGGGGSYRWQMETNVPKDRRTFGAHFTVGAEYRLLSFLGVGVEGRYQIVRGPRQTQEGVERQPTDPESAVQSFSLHMASLAAAVRVGFR